jgi:hypothetical protein
MPVALMGFFTLQSVPLVEIGLPSGSPSHLDVTHRGEHSALTDPASLLWTRLHGVNPPTSPFVHHLVLPG